MSNYTKGKRLSVQELERLPIGTPVIIEKGCINLDYNIDRYWGNLCLKSVNPSGGILYYNDILKLDIYESIGLSQAFIHMDHLNDITYVCAIDWSKDMIDEFHSLSNPITQNYSKPEIRVRREFNVAKKKEFEVPKQTKEQRLRYIIAHVEMNIDKALELGNKDRFIMLTSKLKQLRQAVGGI